MAEAQPIAEPNGCRLCGRGQREHGLEWHEAVGYHNWTEPTDTQRLERMKQATDT